jgi:hypothetical protein
MTILTPSMAACSGVGPTARAAFSPDEKYLATSSRDKLLGVGCSQRQRSRTHDKVSHTQGRWGCGEASILAFRAPSDLATPNKARGVGSSTL